MSTLLPPANNAEDDDSELVTPADYANMPDLYSAIRLELQAVQIAMAHLMSRPEDPLPQALLTTPGIHFTEAGAKRATAVRDSIGLTALTVEHTGDYYYLLLLGRLMLDSPLGPRLVPGATPESPSPIVAALPAIRDNINRVLEACEDFIASSHVDSPHDDDDDDDPVDMREWLAFGRQLVEDTFRRLQHTLGSKLPLAPPLQKPEIWGTYPLTALELKGLISVLLTFRNLPLLSQQPLAQAVVQLPGYHPQKLEKLQAKLAETKSPLTGRVRVRFTEWQVLALYQAARLTAYTMVSGEGFDEGGLDDFLAQSPYLPKKDRERGTSEQIGQMRQLQCALSEGFANLIQHSMGDEPDFRAVRDQVDELLTR